MADSTLRDETAFQWSFLEDVHDPCVVVSDRMEFGYVTRCFEILPVVDDPCAFHCPTMDAVVEDSGESLPEVVYCEETRYKGTGRADCSHAVVTASMITRRPVQVRVRPPSHPMSGSQLPS